MLQNGNMEQNPFYTIFNLYDLLKSPVHPCERNNGLQFGLTTGRHGLSFKLFSLWWIVEMPVP